MAYTTRGSLLSRVRKGDEISWDEFYNTYKRLLYTVGKNSYFLNTGEIEELIQEVMITFFDATKTFKYDKNKGKFRSYLKKIFHYKVLKFKEKKKKTAEKITSVESEEFGIDDLPEPTDSNLDKIWDVEWEKHIMFEAMKELSLRIEPTTYQAFELYTIQNETPQTVAKLLDMKVNAVYACKNRAISQLKEIIQEMND